MGDRSAYQGETILARDVSISNDTWRTGVNNNMLVIGSSGSGKTRHVLKPNLLQMNSSYVVLDTKGSLHHEVGPILAEHGYKVMNLDFTNLDSKDLVGYNPLDYIGHDERTGLYSESDIISLAASLCPEENSLEPFWDRAAADYMVAFIAYVLETLPEQEHDMNAVLLLLEGLGDGRTTTLMEENAIAHPMSISARHYQRTKGGQSADRMVASIIGILAEKTSCLGFREALAMYDNPDRIDFAELGRRKCALFVTISDVDHSLAPLTDTFVFQCLTQLMRSADGYEEGLLPVPVRLFLDDFGNLRINDFDQFISVVRSREIWVTILCQTVAQLQRTYGEFAASCIIGNCDIQLVLGFQDAATASYFTYRADRLQNTLLNTPLDKSWLFIRGQEARQVERYDVTEHPEFREV